ncbi:hypothetical protein Gpo141_00004686 [Globisporangium polare]
MRTPALVVLTVSLVGVTTLVASYEQYRYRLPNASGVPNTRAVGHNKADGGGGTNVFGRDFIMIGYGDWNEALCKKDSDGDGQTNGQELGDPCCAWSQADYPLPHRTNGISHPGDASATSDPVRWKDLNCTEYRILVRRLTSAASSKPSPFASLVLMAVMVVARAILLL